ncbi:response regulator receiver modulated metal-dependent phosphohydrolase [Desulfolithobacter dissulfuricans]|uniref:Response regulator receiver modulated metal-dependent phosphohydrolase n=2 Tax=Desulfolithobacter dissulfuricans TaxID=2795293 RepID=A0A915U9B9_9BACT|nr:response regulator receiver modulated metal-dependent phosphohydrolase [Desulfolithobacter dissulfuricans]
MTEKILLVDDEVNVLQSLTRQLRKRFATHTATSGDEALQILKKEGPFAVIVSDMRMPGMDGIQLLSRVKDLYPETIRIMLTGNADQETAIKAVNKGNIFRFLTKPCSSGTLILALTMALHQYRVESAERNLLDETLRGSVKVLTEILSQANPLAFSSGYRIKHYVVTMARELQLPGLWQFEIAALMSQIGCITLPAEILNKRYANIELTPDEQQMFANHPLVGSRLLGNIPRLENVAAMIAHQLRRFDEYDDGLEEKLAEEVCIGAQLLKTTLDYDLLLYRGMEPAEAMRQMKRDRGAYIQALLRLLEKTKSQERPTEVISLKARDIAPGMIVQEDVFARNGVLLIPKGQEVTWPMIQSLSNFAQQVGIQEPIRVLIGKRGE